MKKTKKEESTFEIPIISREEAEEKGLNMVNILLYILGAIAVIAAGIYFFMRREPATKSAADIARAQSQQESSPELQEESYSEPEPQPEPEQPVQEETPTETTEEEPQSENNDQSSNKDDENNNR